MGRCGLFAMWLWIALACGGLGGGGTEGPSPAPDGPSAVPEAPTVPSPAFKTFRSSGSRKTLAFMGDEVTVTWKNMRGGPVDGTWTMTGDEVAIHWGVTPNYGLTEETYVVQSECSMSFVMGTLKKDGRTHRKPMTFTLDEPRCRRR